MMTGVGDVAMRRLDTRDAARVSSLENGPGQTPRSAADIEPATTLRDVEPGDVGSRR
jgi:hypothetical protein